MPLTHTLPQLTMLTYGRIGEGAVGAVGTVTVTVLSTGEIARPLLYGGRERGGTGGVPNPKRVSTLNPKKPDPLVLVVPVALMANMPDDPEQGFLQDMIPGFGRSPNITFVSRTCMPPGLFMCADDSCAPVMVRARRGCGGMARCAVLGCDVSGCCVLRARAVTCVRVPWARRARWAAQMAEKVLSACWR